MCAHACKFVGMNKTTRLFVRVSDKEKRQFGKAAREYKNLSAFLLSSARDRIRYRKIMDEIKRYDRMFKKSVVMRVFEVAITDAAERLKADCN